MIEAEEQLPADVAGDGAAARASGSRPRACRRPAASPRAPARRCAGRRAACRSTGRRRGSARSRAVDDRVTAGRAPKETSRPAPSATLLCSVWSAVSPCFLTSMLMPLSVESRWRSASELVGVVDEVRHVVAERVDLVGDRVGEQQADAGERRRRSRGRRRATASPRGSRAALQERDERVEDQRDERRRR